MSSPNILLLHLLFLFVFHPIRSYRTSNFTEYCQRRTTCLEFLDCCRWYTDSLCPGPRFEHCLTGINGKPLQRSLACGCGIQKSSSSSSSSASSPPPGPDFAIDDLSPPASFYGNKEMVLSSCRLLMSTLGMHADPCRVFSMCCDALLGDCTPTSPNKLRGRKTIYCTPRSVSSSYCECIPHDQDRIVFDLRRPREGIGSLTQTCSYDSNDCRQFSHCCSGYLDYCPGAKRQVCIPTNDSSSGDSSGVVIGFEKTSALCECEFSTNRGQQRRASAIGVSILVYALIFSNVNS